MNILLIDNYDSFTYNLLHYLTILQVHVSVVRNDSAELEVPSLENVDGIVISPGPGKPADAGFLPDFLPKVINHRPVLGVCLGHQAIGEMYGSKLAHADIPMHGKVSKVYHTGHPMFSGVTDSFQATRYHSLVLNKLAEGLTATAFSQNNELMAFAHKQLPVWGVQFHPEAVLSGFGYRIINNWMQLCSHKNSF